MDKKGPKCSNRNIQRPNYILLNIITKAEAGERQLKAREYPQMLLNYTHMKNTTRILFPRIDDNGYRSYDTSNQYELRHFVGETLEKLLCTCDNALRGLTMCKINMDSYDVLARRTLDYLVIEITHKLA